MNRATPLIASLLLPFALLPGAGAAPGYELRLDNSGWGKASATDILKVLRSSCDSIYQHYDGAEWGEPIRVRRGKEGPITLFRRSVRGEVIVQLDTSDLFWCQYAYQMAHEFCHVLCKFREGGRKNLWFEESLCELASLFAMRSMAESWKTDPPYANWKGYAKSIRSYIGDVEDKYQLPGKTDLADFYKANAGALAENPTDRGKNGRIAVALLPLFEKSPEHWPAVGYLNAGKGKDNLPFPEHLKNWRDQAPEKHRSFISEIAKQFGVSL